MAVSTDLVNWADTGWSVLRRSGTGRETMDWSPYMENHRRAFFRVTVE
ncbi:hypothetical protein [Kiritimatiella glycovorans]|nr:hypothetical protein [Kiritimatiella glycovorans]